MPVDVRTEINGREMILTPRNARNDLTSHQDWDTSVGEEGQEDGGRHDNEGKHVGLLVSDHVTHDTVQDKTQHRSSLSSVHETGLPSVGDFVDTVWQSVSEVAIEGWESEHRT